MCVTIRIRPYLDSDGESPTDSQFPFELGGDGNIIKIFDEPSAVVFDRVYPFTVCTHDIYSDLFQGLVQSACDGFNVTTFAYGQTASGKTHTMLGTPEEPGLVPLSIHQIFEHIQKEDRKKFLLRVSYLEIYNERAYDLLSKGNNTVTIFEDSSKNVSFSNLTEEIVGTESQATELIMKGEALRRVAKTDFNNHSSRSHTVFRMVIESMEAMSVSLPTSTNTGVDPKNRRTSTGGTASKQASPTLMDTDRPGGSVVRVSSLNLVDLAGSETAHAHSSSERRMEGRNINLSLLHLKEIITALSKGEVVTSFRNSKLTRILAPSLRGNAKVAIICNISPSQKHLDYSKRTIEFGNCARRIKVKPKINNYCESALILKYQAEIDELRHEIESLKQLQQLRNEKQQTNAGTDAAPLEEDAMDNSEAIDELQGNLDELTTLVLESNNLKKRLIDEQSDKTVKEERIRQLEAEMCQLAERVQRQEEEKHKAEQRALQYAEHLNKLNREKEQLTERLNLVKRATARAEEEATRNDSLIKMLRNEHKELEVKLKAEEETRKHAEQAAMEKEHELLDLRRANNVLAKQFLHEKTAKETAEKSCELIQSEMAQWAQTHHIINQFMMEDKKVLDLALKEKEEMECTVAQLYNELFKRDEDIDKLKRQLTNAHPPPTPLNPAHRALQVGEEGDNHVTRATPGRTSTPPGPDPGLRLGQTGPGTNKMPSTSKIPNPVLPPIQSPSVKLQINRPSAGSTPISVPDRGNAGMTPSLQALQHQNKQLEEENRVQHEQLGKMQLQLELYELQLTEFGLKHNL